MNFAITSKDKEYGGEYAAIFLHVSEIIQAHPQRSYH